MKKILFTVIFVIALSSSQAHAYRVPERDYWKHFTLSLINESRRLEGLSPLGIDDKLNDLAQAHAVDSALHFDDQSYESRRATYIIHTSSDHGTLSDRVREHNIQNIIRAGENVGFRYQKPFGDPMEAIMKAITLMHEGMMAEIPPDDGHRRTMLGDFSHVGVGLELHREIESNENTVFFVTDFSKFSDNRAQIIPELGLVPRWNQEKLTITKNHSPSRIIERRVRVRTPIVRATISVESESSDGRKDPQRRQSEQTLSWSDRNLARVTARQSERSASLHFRF